MAPQQWSIATMAHPIPKPSDPAALDDQFMAFVEIVRLLRRQCPWDREQTHESISHLLIEESYETLDAIEQGDDVEFKKELGDLLLHVVMHSIIAEERGSFTLREVIEQVAAKLVRRHPHVFGDVEAHQPDQVMQNWERLKMQEGRDSILAGVPKHLPALLRAQRMQEKAAHVGFDWKSSDDVWNKVREEIDELQQATDSESFAAEFGDLLFALVNTARHAGVVAETVLQSTNDKFQRRFQYIEQQAYQRGEPIESFTLEQLDAWWNQAKRERL
ncbi:MAG: nucleoside triphosphate pyrophosphohydrolase [Chlorobi bacterium]|nr:nucleoside triphosphate pyrophosphohydrolase [Chlorobiota bacterium]